MKHYLPFLILIIIVGGLILTQVPRSFLNQRPNNFAPTVKSSATSSITITVKIPKRAAPPPTPPPTPPSGGGGGGGGPAVVPAPLPTKVIFKGFSSPNALVYIYKDGALAASFVSTAEGTFYRELTGLYGKIYNFTFAAEDKEKRPTMTVSVTASVLEGAITTIANIFLPPTMELKSQRVVRGEKLTISGATYPKSNVTTIIVPRDITEQTIADKNGYWKLSLDTKPVPEGVYFAAASAQTPEGLQSPQTQILQFAVISAARECRGPDINLDGKVNIYDFSILMFWWHAPHIIHCCVDINKDGKVNLTDFSIMMFNWGKKI